MRLDTGVTPRSRRECLERMLVELEDLLWQIAATLAELELSP